MTPLRWISVVVLILGIASLVVPIPHAERHGIDVVDVSLGVITHNDEKVPVAVSVTMILAGLAVAAIGSRQHS
jgi:hypothetical protein